MSAPSIMQDGNRLVVFGSQLIGVVIVVISLLTEQGELHSLRPQGRANMSAPAKTEENDRFARLWDDPLEDASPSPAPTPSPTPSPSPAPTPSPTPPPSPTPTPETPSYTFLWNILDAGPWPAARERRLRIRYAIVSAILAEGYRPPRGSVLHSLRRLGRFETFRKASMQGNGKYEYVCVIWTPKQSTELPIDQCKLRKIMAEIGNQDNLIAEAKVRILHHGTSQDLIDYLVAPSASTAASPEQSISFMRATIPLDDLELGISSLTPNRPFVQKVTTDDKLVDALFRELCLRIPALNDKKKAPRLVVFTESDTIYSKAIVCELEQQLEQTNARLEVYSYLQALDGRPEEARAPANPSGSKPPDIATLLLQGSAISETSFGTSQFDYLRRAALDLKAARNQNVVAVGILGSDIYDKMLVLQAVRPVLPAAVFFTTDLDALYLERSMEPFTRNLVVASADDLGANESDDATTNWKLPPMRDSYQTVLVKEVQNILRGDASEKSGSAHIFEIAAGRPIDLTTAGGTSWPLWWLAQDWFNPLIFVLALGNAILILCAVTTRNKENCPPGAMKKWAKWLVYGETMLAGFCIIILLLILVLWNPIVGKLDSVFGLNLSYLDIFGEPLTLGVSIWPSIMIRLLAFGVAIFLLSLASRSFVVHGLTQKEDLGKALGGTIRFKGRAKKGGKVVGFEHFFQQLFEWKHVRWRIVIFSIVYLGVSFLLFMIWPPTVPGRGGSALLIEKIVLALGVALYIVHLIFCLVLHWHALRLLYGIGSHFESEHERTRARPAGAQQGGDPINLEQMLTCLGTLTTVIGKTLLYPLTVLVLIILSRLSIFDNWVMTPSLTITFALGAIVLVAASLILWLEGARLKRLVMAQRKGPAKLKLEAVSDGVFAAWYNQPIFSAILSALAVFGTLTVAGPLTKLFGAS